MLWFRLPLVLLICSAIAAAPGQADDVEAVRGKLQKAREEYDGEVQKFNKAVASSLDAREEVARAKTSKKMVDEIKAQRKAFEGDGELPPLVPPGAYTQIRLAVSKLDKAHADAVKELVRQKHDAAAEAVEKEQRRFAFEAALQYGKRTYLSTLKPFDVRVQHNPFTSNGTLRAGKNETKFKVNGNFVPHSLLTHPPERDSAQVRYSINGNWTAFRASVGVPTIDEERSPESALTFEVLGDGKSLWKSEPVTQRDVFQTCTLRIEKVKVLALQVHCADGYRWGRGVWVEAVIIE